MATSSSIEIFSSEDQTVIFRPARRPARTIAATFTPETFTDTSQPGLLEAQIAAEDVDQIIFKNAGAEWYQTLPDQALETAAVILRNGCYRRRVGFGISMGGYAAMAFAQPLELTDLGVIAPQVTLDPSKVGNWAAQYSAITWRWPVTGPGLAGVRRICYAYDPISPDEVSQMACLRAFYPKRWIDRLEIPFSDTQTAEVMEAEGLMHPFLLAVLHGTPCPRRDNRLPPRGQPRGLARIGRALIKRRKFPGAERAFRRACMADNSLGFVWSGWLDTLIELERFDAAHEVARDVVRYHSSDPEVLLMVGRLHRRCGDLAKSQDFAERAIEADPANGSAHILLGQVLLDRGRLLAAKTAAADALRTAHRYPRERSGAKALLNRISTLAVAVGLPAEGSR